MQCNDVDDILELEPVKNWDYDWKSYINFDLCSIHYSGEYCAGIDTSAENLFTELSKNENTLYFKPIYSNYDTNDEVTYENIKVYEIACQNEDKYVSISVYVDTWIYNEVVAITTEVE